MPSLEGKAFINITIYFINVSIYEIENSFFKVIGNRQKK